jgi:hypothetical protein
MRQTPKVAFQKQIHESLAFENDTEEENKNPKQWHFKQNLNKKLIFSLLI